MKYFGNIGNDWIQSTIFAKRSIFSCFTGFWIRLWLSRGFFCYYGGFQFEYFTNLSNLISILLKYLEHKFPDRCNQLISCNKLCLKPVKTSQYRRTKAFNKLLWLLFWLLGTCSQLARLFLLATMIKYKQEGKLYNWETSVTSVSMCCNSVTKNKKHKLSLTKCLYFFNTKYMSNIYIYI